MVIDRWAILITLEEAQASIPIMVKMVKTASTTSAEESRTVNSQKQRTTICGKPIRTYLQVSWVRHDTCLEVSYNAVENALNNSRPAIPEILESVGLDLSVFCKQLTNPFENEEAEHGKDDEDDEEYVSRQEYVCKLNAGPETNTVDASHDSCGPTNLSWRPTVASWNESFGSATEQFSGSFQRPWDQSPRASADKSARDFQRPLLNLD